MVEELAEVPNIVSQDRIQQGTVEQTVDTPVPQFTARGIFSRDFDFRNCLQVAFRVDLDLKIVLRGRALLLESIRTQLDDTESVTSLQETGKVAMTKDNFEIACWTCTCGCKRGQTKEKQCLSALRAPTSSTIARL